MKMKMKMNMIMKNKIKMKIRYFTIWNHWSFWHHMRIKMKNKSTEQNSVVKWRCRSKVDVLGISINAECHCAHTKIISDLKIFIIRVAMKSFKYCLPTISVNFLCTLNTISDVLVVRHIICQKLKVKKEEEEICL